MAWPLLAGPPLLDKVQSFYDKTSSMQANFKQTYWNKLFNRKETSEGKLSYQKPAQIRWDYEKPTKKSFILNKSTLWLVEPEEKVAQVNKCFESDALTASLVFLGGKGKLKDQFKLEKSVKSNELILTPKTKNQMLAKLTLRVDIKTGQVLGSTVTDSDGNTNHFEYLGARTNLKISANQFEYKAIKGMQLIDMPGSCKQK